MLTRIAVMLTATFISGGAHAQDDLLSSGRAAFNTGDYETARVIYEKALKADPANAKVLNNRALIAFRQGRLGDALADLTAALQIAPLDGTIWNNRANVNCALNAFADSFSDRMQAMNNDRFTAAQAQAGLRKSGYYRGPADGIWIDDSQRALEDWTRAGCPDAPASRLL